MTKESATIEPDSKGTEGMLKVEPAINEMTVIIPAETERKCGTVEKKGWGIESSWIIQQAYDISDCDKNFVLMLEAENGMWDFKRQSSYINEYGREPSFGLCQIHKGFHPQIVNDPRFFTDQIWQLQQCLRLWRGGTVFYGASPYKRKLASKNIIFYDN